MAGRLRRYLVGDEAQLGGELRSLLDALDVVLEGVLIAGCVWVVLAGLYVAAPGFVNAIGSLLGGW